MQQIIIKNKFTHSDEAKLTSRPTKIIEKIYLWPIGCITHMGLTEGLFEKWFWYDYRLSKKESRIISIFLNMFNQL